MSFNTFSKLIAFSLIFLIYTSNAFSQNFLRINEEIDPGGGTNVTHETSDNTLLYVLGGAIVAGIVVYAVLKHNKRKAEEEDTVSTVISKKKIIADYFDKPEYDYSKARDKIPVDLYLGVQNNAINSSDKRYLLGLSVRF